MSKIAIFFHTPPAFDISVSDSRSNIGVEKLEWLIYQLVQKFYDSRVTDWYTDVLQQRSPRRAVKKL